MLLQSYGYLSDLEKEYGDADSFLNSELEN